MTKLPWKIIYKQQEFSFESYDLAVESLKQSFNWGRQLCIAPEKHTLPETVLGFRTPDGNWIELKPIVLLTETIDIQKDK